MSRVNSKTKLGSRQKSRNDKKSNVDAEPTKKIEIPQLAWKVVSESSARLLRETPDIDEVARKLADILSLDASQECMKEAAQLDYFVAGYWHAVNEWNLTNEQMSAFITILDTLLNNIKKRGLSLGENLKELQTLMSGVGIPNVPTPLECFTSELVVTVLHYLQSTLFQHYLLFEFLFTEDQQEETHTAQLEVALPNIDQTVFPPPLEESIPLELYERCVAPDVCAKTESSSSTSTSQTQTQETVPSQEAVVDDVVQSTEDVTDGTVEEELQVSADDLAKLMESMTQTTLQSFQTQMLQKIKEKEDVMANRLSKLERTLNTHH